MTAFAVALEVLLGEKMESCDWDIALSLKERGPGSRWPWSLVSVSMGRLCDFGHITPCPGLLPCCDMRGLYQKVLWLKMPASFRKQSPSSSSLPFPCCLFKTKVYFSALFNRKALIYAVERPRRNSRAISTKTSRSESFLVRTSSNRLPLGLPDRIQPWLLIYLSEHSLVLRDRAGNLAGPCPLSLISTLVWQKPSRPAGPEHAQPGEPCPTKGYSLPSQPVIQLSPVLQLRQPTLAPSIFSGFLLAFFCSGFLCPFLILSTCRCHPHAFMPSLPLLLRLGLERWRDWAWPRAQPTEHTQYEREGRAVWGEGHHHGPLCQFHSEGAGSHAWCEAEFCGRGVHTTLTLGSSP